jgi:toxin ParE1/3/4
VRVVWSPAALRDVSRIHAYITQFDPQAAQRLAERFFEASESLGQHPHIGRPVAGGRRELLTVPPYVIVYRALPAETRILRVWHGAQLRD